MSAKKQQGPCGVHQRVSEVASNKPSRIAVVEGDLVMTYGELESRSSAFCAELASAEVASGSRVGILLENSAEFLIVALGIWKHGAVAVPLNPRYQDRELLQYSIDSSMCAVITRARNAQLVRGLQQRGAPIHSVWLSSPGERPRMLDVHRPSLTRTAAPSHPDAILGAAISQYSSGSSGRPKRITRSHADLLAEHDAVASTLKTCAEDRVLGLAPFFHSHGLMNAAMLALLSGATLYAVDSFFPKDVARLVEREAISLFPGVPVMFQLLIELSRHCDFSSVRTALSAGAPLPAETAQAFAERFAVRLRQLYGSTETGVISISDAQTAERSPDSVGRPVPGVLVDVVDDQGTPRGEGTIGLIKVTSPFMASGYDGCAEGTDSYFRSGSFFPGDMGQIMPAGEIILSGRRRGFINVGGLKVDPVEVEQVLRDLPGVHEAAVCGIRDGASGEKIKAVVVAKNDVTDMLVRRHCESRLADYKQPKMIEFRKELPKSPLGKILRKYLTDEFEGGAPEHLFDPISGFTLDPGRSASEQAPRYADVPPFLRVLLSTDGTVTRSLEAYFLEPIDIEILSHAYEASDRNYEHIGVDLGDLVLRRRVILRGRVTGTAYAFAESVIDARGVPEDLRGVLIEKRKGIGEVLRETRRETFRQLHSVRKANAAEWRVPLSLDVTESVFVRSYTICLERRTAILIEEVFPELRFREGTPKFRA